MFDCLIQRIYTKQNGAWRSDNSIFKVDMPASKVSNVFARTATLNFVIICENYNIEIRNIPKYLSI